VDNSAGPATLAVTIRAVRYDAGEGQDIIVTASGSVTVSAASETLAVADRGGLGADSLFSYEWDINDRLTAVEAVSAVPPADRRRVEFAYDYQGRRVSKRVFGFVVPPSGGPGSWQLQSDTRFVYDGWNLLAELGVPASAGPVPLRSYLWGLDLDGLRTGIPGQEAGGIGGLIAVTEWSGTPPAPSSALYAVADGNGNVAVLVDAESEAGVVETTEHEPFGRVVARHRADAGALPAGSGSLCPFGFSTKYLDPETGLQYFGYRYLSPDLGRWLCRDPLGEKGGANLYAYCQNDPVNAVDPLGLGTLDLRRGTNDVAIQAQVDGDRDLQQLIRQTGLVALGEPTFWGYLAEALRETSAELVEYSFSIAATGGCSRPGRGLARPHGSADSKGLEMEYFARKEQYLDASLRNTYLDKYQRALEQVDAAPNARQRATAEQRANRYREVVERNSGKYAALEKEARIGATKRAIDWVKSQVGKRSQVMLQQGDAGYAHTHGPGGEGAASTPNVNERREAHGDTLPLANAEREFPGSGVKWGFLAVAVFPFYDPDWELLPEGERPQKTSELMVFTATQAARGTSVFIRY
jgi:RHS repeat-associated protein